LPPGSAPSWVFSLCSCRPQLTQYRLNFWPSPSIPCGPGLLYFVPHLIPQDVSGFGSDLVIFFLISIFSPFVFVSLLGICSTRRFFLHPSFDWRDSFRLMYLIPSTLPDLQGAGASVANSNSPLSLLIEPVTPPLSQFELLLVRIVPPFRYFARLFFLAFSPFGNPLGYDGLFFGDAHISLFLLTAKLLLFAG